MRIVFFGTPEFAVPALNALVMSGENIEAVVTQPDKKKGRGHTLSQSPVKELSLGKGIRVIQPQTMKDMDFLNEISVIKPDLIVVVAYGKVLPKSILELPPFGCVNVHASLLPKYRGAAPVAWAIINGEKTTGITTMLMDEGLDTGHMLLKEEINISDDDTTETLSLKLSEIGASLLIRTIKGIKDGSIKPIPQKGESTYAAMIKKEDGKVDWSRSADELSCFVRGMYPWPCSYCYFDDERIKLIKVKALEGSGKPGRIETARKDMLIVGTGSGLLSVLELQPEGKKTMQAGAFLSGRHIKEGQYFK